MSFTVRLLLICNLTLEMYMHKEKVYVEDST